MTEGWSLELMSDAPSASLEVKLANGKVRVADQLKYGPPTSLGERGRCEQAVAKGWSEGRNGIATVPTWKV